MLFFWYYQFRVKLECIRTITFFLVTHSLSRPILAWNEGIMMFSNFFHFFFLFCWNSLFRVGLEWIGMIIFFFFNLILGLSHLGLAWKEAIIMFFNFVNFFALFLEFPTPGRNDNFFFFHSQSVPYHFGLKWRRNDVF